MEEQEKNAPERSFMGIWVKLIMSEQYIFVNETKHVKSGEMNVLLNVQWRSCSSSFCFLWSWRCLLPIKRKKAIELRLIITSIGLMVTHRRAHEWRRQQVFLYCRADGNSGHVLVPTARHQPHCCCSAGNSLFHALCNGNQTQSEDN